MLALPVSLGTHDLKSAQNSLPFPAVDTESTIVRSLVDSVAQIYRQRIRACRLPLAECFSKGIGRREWSRRGEGGRCQKAELEKLYRDEHDCRE